MMLRSFLSAATITMVGISAAANVSQKMGSYDFSYSTAGDARVKPVQVFDDGQSTYFQFRAGEAIPAIFAVGSGAPVLMVPRIEGPFVRLESVAKRFDLRLGKSTGSVTYAGEEAAAANHARAINIPAAVSPSRTGGAFAQVVTPGAAQNAPQNTVLPPQSLAFASQSIGINGLPRAVYSDEPTPRIALDLNSYAIPVRGDVAQFQPNGVSPRVEATSGAGETVLSEARPVPFVPGSFILGPKGRAAVASASKQYRPGARVEVMGHYDSTYKEGLAKARVDSVVRQLVTQGVPQAVISVKTTDAVNSNQVASGLVGATISIGLPGSAGNLTHAFVDTRQQTEADLDSVISQLKAGRVSASAAAKQVEQIRNAAAQRNVQPHSGWQEAQITRWEMRKADVTIQTMLQRWATEAGWQLIWKNGPDVQIQGDAVLMRDGFVSASDYVLAQARSFGHKVKGRAYNNKVLVISAE